MRVCFVGDSFAPRHLAKAAEAKGLTLSSIEDADLVFLSQDTPTDEYGNRDLAPIRQMIEEAKNVRAPMVLTSQVPPGFTRALNLPIYYQAETLRVTQDSEERALHPEQHIVGCADPEKPLPFAYERYLDEFTDKWRGVQTPILKMTYEEAEFAKMAINAFLAAQVDATNRLAKLANACGARWEPIAEVLRHDKRIGPYAYLTPGRWQDSLHLLRDMATLQEIECKADSK